MKAADIQIRDPCVYAHQQEKIYYMFGTTDHNCWRGPGQGFDCYYSKDLREWEGPIPAFKPSGHFWGKENFWAPEAHKFNDRFYMFASFKAEKRYRATQILTAQDVVGPYLPLVDESVTPPDWQCLDGTLHVDEAGNPWMVFCHEWVQIHNGAICAMQLTSDLKEAVGRPLFLFNASEARWVQESDWPEKDAKYRFPTYVTDGPFLPRLSDGTLLMLWSSLGAKGYAMGVSRSENGQISGPWHHDPDPIWAEDGRHGMIFKTFAGQLMLTFHSPNQSPNERAVFVEIEEKDGGIQLKM
ncbi:MAG: glycoside hydrolase family 43 protein [Anaerolineae bacterium]|nr:glycoside hydrolase family 43 protein [Anaerolineae bacterium]